MQLTHSTPTPPRGGDTIACTAATACPHSVNSHDPRAALITANHLHTEHGIPLPKRRRGGTR
ncbi:hypothetical protein ACEZCY_14505 [Streptacidiphilus sp. N1-12]|uniref:Uncharacterized protein n=2 Tax=Streptacidiphilus alkalitolerans TaxID=3342712 RepID=A0ABV6VA48_9ACTN